MGMKFRKSKKIAPGVKVNIGKKGASVTFGPKGVHHTISTTGRRTTSIGVPGSGISYVKSTGGNSKRSNSKSENNTSADLRLIKCPNCERSFPEGVKKCPVCGAQFSKTYNDNNSCDDIINSPKWYQQTGWIIGLLFLFFPIGLYLMWRYAEWKKTPKIIVSAILCIGILGVIFSPKIEKISLSADTASIYDINETVAIKVITEPENLTIPDSAIKISGGSASMADGEILFIADNPGKYSIHVKDSNTKSNNIILKYEDKAAIAKQEKEQAQKKAAEEAAKKKAEEVASQKLAEEKAAKKKAEEEAIAQKQAEEVAAQAEQERLAAEAAAQEQAQQEAEIQVAIDNSDPIVYITDTGEKYHSAGCRTLDDSQHERHLSEVVGSYGPCGICHPPTL